MTSQNMPSDNVATTTTYDYLPAFDTINNTFKDDAATLRWTLRNIPKDRQGDFLADWNDKEDLIEWMGRMTNWVAFVADPNRFPAPVFPNFEPRARWVLEQVDKGTIDHSELYDFIRDWTFCKGMEPWYAEVENRKEAANGMAEGSQD